MRTPPSRRVDALTLAALLLTGALAGFLSALFGIGGGIVMVPVMHYVLGIAWHEATAYSLMAIALMTPLAVLQHARRGAVSWRLGGWMALGGAVGVFVGEALEPHVPVPILKLLFAALLLLAAWRMRAGPVAARFYTQHVALLVATGLVCGISAKLLGIGGGLISVPVLTLFGTSIHTAVASSLVPVFTNGALASASKLAEGAGLWLGAVLAAGGLAGIPLGARAAHSLEAGRLKRVFAIALVLAALYIGATSGAF